MIHLNKQIDYAVQLLIALSELDEKEYMSLRKFSQDSNISFLFLQRIARALKEAKMIGAERGIYGGYYLKKDIKKISLKTIIEAVEGKFGVTACIYEKDCPRIDVCTARPLFHSLNNKISALLADTYIV